MTTIFDNNNKVIRWCVNVLMRNDRYRYNKISRKYLGIENMKSSGKDLAVINEN